MSGADALPGFALDDELRAGLADHLDGLRETYRRIGWGSRGGYGRRPALLVVDLANLWTDHSSKIGADLDAVVDATGRLIDAARRADVPVFFTTTILGEDDPPLPRERKDTVARTYGGPSGTELDPRLNRRPNEKLIAKKYASAFKGTDLQEMLTTLGVDTLVVTGCSTSHCIYATCRDAVSFRVVVPEEAVGDRSELAHMVFLFDIDMVLGDVTSAGEVEAYFESLSERPASVTESASPATG